MRVGKGMDGRSGNNLEAGIELYFLGGLISLVAEYGELHISGVICIERNCHFESKGVRFLGVTSTFAREFGCEVTLYLQRGYEGIYIVCVLFA